MATPLCLWRPGDSITAHRLNEMTTTLNDAAKQAEALASELNSITSASTSTIGGLPSARVISTAKGQFMEQNRGVILDQWDFHINSGNECGIYVRCSGFENATSVSYPDAPSISKIAAYSEATNGDELMQIIYTDCWGNVTCSKIEILKEIPSDTKLWSGPVEPAPSDAPSPDGPIKFYRRLGRIVDSCIEFACGSTPLRKVMETNDVVMPILPVRSEKEATNNGIKSHSLVGDFIGNSVLIKNIQNGGGIKSESSQSGVKLQSGIQVVTGCITESDESTGEPSISWPEAPQGPEPQPYDVVAMCIPVKEQKYKWNKETSTWEKSSIESSCGSTTEEAEIKSYVKLQAKSLDDKNWVLGLVGSGEIEIPVRDFIPSEGIAYEAGRGISICEQNVNTGTEEDPVWGSKHVICNTMEICAGCGISIEQTDTEKPAYKINACKIKMEAGDGICVSEIQGGWKVSAKDPCIKITGGEGINVTGGPKCWTISNTTTYVPTEVVAGNGICVVQTGNKYKVSIKPPCSTCCVCICGVKYSFDPTWFTVTNNTVTINEAKINQVAEGIAPNVSSSITTTTTAAIDTYSDVSIRCDTVTGRFGGDVMATVNTTSGESATASFSTRETWRN